jgi:hypothetical protein
MKRRDQYSVVSGHMAKTRRLMKTTCSRRNRRGGEGLKDPISSSNPEMRNLVAESEEHPAQQM